MSSYNHLYELWKHMDGYKSFEDMHERENFFRSMLTHVANIDTHIQVKDHNNIRHVHKQ